MNDKLETKLKLIFQANSQFSQHGKKLYKKNTKYFIKNKRQILKIFKLNIIIKVYQNRNCNDIKHVKNT